MRTHFSYTVPRGNTLLRRGIDKAITLTGGIIPPLHRSGIDSLIPWQHPIRAPHSISYQLLHALKEHSPTRFYSMYEHTIAPLAKEDVFIGQPLPAGGFGSSRPDTDDPESITSRTLRNYPHNRRFLIMPYAHDPLLVSWAKNLIQESSPELIFIGGPIWQEQWADRSPFRDISIRRKIHVEMGIDMQDYPLVKKRFNKKGARKFLYIGHTSWYKNTAELERIAQTLPGFEGAHIGGGEVKGWKKLDNFAALTPEFMGELAQEYDIFVNTSTADAQATTILEQMCFGMAVACTPESGYSYPSLTKLSVTDTAFNVEALHALQWMDEEELLARAESNRRIASERHTWERFTQEVLDFMK